MLLIVVYSLNRVADYSHNIHRKCKQGIASPRVIPRIFLYKTDAQINLFRLASWPSVASPSMRVSHPLERKPLPPPPLVPLARASWWKVTLPHVNERLVDSQLYQPIPFQAALDDGCTHVLVIRSRPDGGCRPGRFLGCVEQDQLDRILAGTSYL